MPAWLHVVLAILCVGAVLGFTVVLSRGEELADEWRRRWAVSSGLHGLATEDLFAMSVACKTARSAAAVSLRKAIERDRATVYLVQERDRIRELAWVARQVDRELRRRGAETPGDAPVSGRE